MRFASRRQVESCTMDAFCESTFGADSQVSVLGYIHIKRTADAKYADKFYVTHCKTCAEDPELFGEAMFITNKSGLQNNKLPCGCSKNPKWEEWQFKKLTKRKLENAGYSLANISDDYVGQHTKLTALCTKHGEWSTTITAIYNKNNFCRLCADEQNSLNNRKPDNVMIKSFMETGMYPLGTIFERSDRRTSQGAKNYWTIMCPVCNDISESTTSDLKRGFIPCSCKIEMQDKAYINSLKDSQNNIIAIKFGISNNPLYRHYDIRKRSKLTVELLGYWQFPNKMSCLKAERECKSVLETSVVPRDHLPDGFTETTHTYNLDKIIDIYELNGGTLVT